MQNIYKLRKIVMAFAALLVCVMVGSTWAYWSQVLYAHNEFGLGKYDTKIVDVFTPPESWLPGQDVSKEVGVRNDGSVPVFVKVTLSQKWLRTEDVVDGSGNIVKPSKGEEIPLSFDTEGGKEYAANILWGPDVVLLSGLKMQPLFVQASQLISAQASRPAGIPVVGSMQDAQGKWLLISDTPDAAGNYTLYYIGALGPGKVTPLIVNGVRLNDNLQATTIETHTVWDKQAQQWVTTTVENPVYSYENARYTLTVTMDTVQATNDAATATFPAANTADRAVITYLESISSPAEDFSPNNINRAAQTDTLYFDKVNGKMRYTPVKGNSGNWFMDWLNMLPGGHYTESLNIENRSSKPYDLYMQVIPLEQSAQLDALLGYIAMKVYYENTLIYDGTALGKTYPGSIKNLQKVIFLGNYGAGKANQIRVDLILNKDTPLEYAGLITKIDWEFMVVDGKVAEPLKPSSGGPGVPKTGDESNLPLYLLVMSASGAALAVCLVYLRKSKRRDNCAAGGGSGIDH